jgi:RNA-directed DNA polymerase
MDDPISKQLTTEEESLLKRMRETDGMKGISGKIIQMRQTLALKAKREPNFRFYSLYGHVCRRDILEAAWRLIRNNNGSPEIDGISFKDITDESGALEKLITETLKELKERTYKPQPIKRVYIPKSDGKLRPLGIPTIKDRLVQMAVLLIIEPIFEADFLDCSHGFRPGISAHKAVRKIEDNIKKSGRVAFYDADIQGYFDSIPHDKLLACVRMRITDSSVIKLLRMWLKAPVIERDKEGMTKASRPTCGTPQGGIISPLLSNLYLHWFDKAFHRKDGPGQTIKAKLIRYADDFIVLTRYKSLQMNEFIREKIEGWLGLTLNRKKTRVGCLRKKGATIQFLGFQIGFAKSKPWIGGQYLKICPNKKAMQKARGKIRELTNRRNNCKPIKEVVKGLNLFLAGWSNYFQLGHPYVAFRDLDTYIQDRLIKHLQRRSQRGFRRGKDKSWFETLKDLGLTRLSSYEGEAFRKAVCKKFARTV